MRGVKVETKCGVRNSECGMVRIEGVRMYEGTKVRPRIAYIRTFVLSYGVCLHVAR